MPIELLIVLPTVLPWGGGVGGEGGRTLSVFLEKQLHLHVSYKYVLSYFQKAFFADKKPPEAEHAEGLAQGFGGIQSPSLA